MTRTQQLYELEVMLLSGPIAKSYVDKNPTVARTIQIRGSQTLADLHKVIFRAFDRFDEHMYEFQVGGKGPMDPNARRYVLSMAMEDPFNDSKPAGDVAHTTIESLELKHDQTFGYWFDFGDDWWHQVTVVAIHDEIPSGRYPKITQKIGESPPQYGDWDEEDCDDN